MSEGKITRSSSLLAFGVLSVIVGLCSFCGTCSYKGANHIVPLNYCAGASQKVAVKGDVFLLPLENGCWTEGLRAKSGIITTISDNNERYDVYCADGKGLDGTGTLRLNACAEPIYFKAKDNSFKLRVVVE